MAGNSCIYEPRSTQLTPVSRGQAEQRLQLRQPRRYGMLPHAMLIPSLRTVFGLSRSVL